MHRTPSKAQCLIRALAGACPLLVALVLVFVSPRANASDDKVYPATSCRQVQGSTGAQGTRNDGSVRNDSTSLPLNLVCPIVRDDTQTTGSWTIEVRADDRTSTGFISCTATSMTSSGVAVIGGSATGQTAMVPMGAAWLALKPLVQSSDGYSVLKCTIPPLQVGNGSGLLGFVVRETGDSTTETDQKSYTATYAEYLPGAVGAFPYIQYDDQGHARTINVGADDDWVLPLVRDSTQAWWTRARFRFADSDADQIANCSIANYDENGSVVGLVATAFQDLAPGNATVTLVAPNNPLYSGPIAMRCNRMAADVTANMYDIREEISS